MLDEVQVTCPYCGEPITVLADCSAGDLSYIEDCSVCCQPIQISLSVSPGGELESIEATQENP